jgi:sarcosine oxidase, subunit delta
VQLIDCPWCGPREEVEFSYGGEAHVAYPEDPAALDDEQWAHYVFFRANPKGRFAERWCHTAGCRRWFNAVRNTATYRFEAVYRPDEPRPFETELARSREHAAAVTGPTSVREEAP